MRIVLVCLTTEVFPLPRAEAVNQSIQQERQKIAKLCRMTNAIKWYFFSILQTNLDLCSQSLQT
jgi:hypothetical protein